MTTMDDFKADFDNLKERTLHLRMDDKCYQLNLSYVPFLEITDYVNYVNNLDITIKFILFSTTEFDATQNILVTVFKSEEEKFRIQTLYIKLTRIITSDLSKFEDIFPPKPEGKMEQLKNIKKLEIGLNSFDKF